MYCVDLPISLLVSLIFLDIFSWHINFQQWALHAFISMKNKKKATLKYEVLILTNHIDQSDSEADCKSLNTMHFPRK